MSAVYVCSLCGTLFAALGLTDADEEPPPREHDA